MGALIGGVSAIAIGAYIGVVVWNGNASRLIDELAKDYGYLEFLLAFAFLGTLVRNPATHEIGVMLILAALLAGGLLFVARTPDVTAALKDFSDGKTGLFETLKKLAT